jgi:hypothetical protein
VASGPKRRARLLKSNPARVVDSQNSRCQYPYLLGLLGFRFNIFEYAPCAFNVRFCPVLGRIAWGLLDCIGVLRGASWDPYPLVGRIGKSAPVQGRANRARIRPWWLERGRVYRVAPIGPHYFWFAFFLVQAVRPRSAMTLIRACTACP